jgi:hypothetical protein
MLINVQVVPSVSSGGSPQIVLLLLLLLLPRATVTTRRGVLCSRLFAWQERPGIDAVNNKDMPTRETD